MDNLTCITCGVKFVVREEGGLDREEAYGRAVTEHRDHYRSDWHRYNLKRKVLELPAITSEAFSEKVLQQKAKQNEEKEFSGRCDLCNKSFSSSNAFENHLKSKKHRDLETKKNCKTQVKNILLDVDRKNVGNKTQGNERKEEVVERLEKMDDDKPRCSGNMDDEEDDEWEDEDGEGLGLEECLFCSKISKTMEKNIAHMSISHGFYIPDLEYVSDLEGLVTYLGQVVGEIHLCLFCKRQRFRDTKATQQHMTDKSHCKMLHDAENVIEYADFYDYRKSYPDHEDKKKKNEEEEEEEEDVEVEPFIMDQSGFQLVLPSGATVGHRSLMRYFQQKLNPDRRVILHRNSSSVSKVISQYKALGWTGTTGILAEKKAKDIAFVNRLQSKHLMKLGIKANSLQKHFRDQVFGYGY